MTVGESEMAESGGAGYADGRSSACSVDASLGFCETSVEYTNAAARVTAAGGGTAGGAVDFGGGAIDAFAAAWMIASSWGITEAK